MADTALNGAQVTAMQGIVTAVANREIPRDAGAAILVRAFQMQPAAADALLGSAGKTFTPPTDEPKGA